MLRLSHKRAGWIGIVVGKRVGRLKHWGCDSLVGGSGAVRLRQIPQGAYDMIQKSTFQVAPGFQYLCPSSLGLIFHSWLRTPDGSRAQSICHEGSFQRGHSSRNPSLLRKNVIFHTNVTPVKFLSFFFFFHPLCCLALCRQTWRLASARPASSLRSDSWQTDAISLRLCQTLPYKKKKKCWRETRNCSDVTGKILEPNSCGCLLKKKKREIAFLTPFIVFHSSDDFTEWSMKHLS